MRKIFLLLVACFFLSMMANAQTGITDKDQFVKHLFTILSKKDTGAFIKLFPDYAGFKKLMRELMDSTGMPADLRIKIDSLTEKQFQQEFMSEILSNFKTALNSGDKLEIGWASIVMTGWEEEKQNDDAGTIKAFGGKIHFTDNQKEYYIPFRQVIWSKNDQCWYGVSLRSVNEKGRPGENDEINSDSLVSVDSMMMSVDTSRMNPVPNKKIKPKTTTPKKTPVKTKTQTPARKPEIKK